MDEDEEDDVCFEEDDDNVGKKRTQNYKELTDEVTAEENDDDEEAEDDHQGEPTTSKNVEAAATKTVVLESTPEVLNSKDKIVDFRVCKAVANYEGRYCCTRTEDMESKDFEKEGNKGMIKTGYLKSHKCMTCKLQLEYMNKKQVAEEKKKAIRTNSWFTREQPLYVCRSCLANETKGVDALHVLCAECSLDMILGNKKVKVVDPTFTDDIEPTGTDE